MANLRRDDTRSLETKLVEQLDNNAKKQMTERPSAEQKYYLPEVLVSLYPVPNLFDWTTEKHGPFEFEESDMVYS